MVLPSVFAYLDYRSFLRDWLDAKKRADDTYSYATFAGEGGCSKSALANVLSGARSPRPGTLDAFARAIAMSPSERNYLGLLVDLSMAHSLDDRRRVMEQILSSERYRQVRMAEGERDSDVFRYLEHWYIPAIRELASLPAFRPEPEWIVGVLRPPISLAQAQDALDRLFELDFLDRLPDGTVEPGDVQFRTEPENAQAATLRFHREVIPGLLTHLQGGDASKQQHVMAATISLPPDLVPEAKARVSALVLQLAAMADAAGVEGEQRVYQVAVQLLPLSEGVG